MGGNNDFFENFERNKYLKKLPSMQRVNNMENEAFLMSSLISQMHLNDFNNQLPDSNEF